MEYCFDIVTQNITVKVFGKFVSKEILPSEGLSTLVQVQFSTRKETLIKTISIRFYAIG